MKVTRVAYSKNLNAGKYAQLEEQARRLGVVRTLVWNRFGSVSGVGVKDRAVRDQWLKDGTHLRFGVPANAWKETLRDAMADICASRAAAKVKVRQAIRRKRAAEAEKKRLYTDLKYDWWTNDPYLCRMMRRHSNRGRNHTYNQIVVRSDKYNTFVHANGNVWISVPSLERRKPIRIPLNTAVAPTGTLRLILRNNRVEVHYAIDSSTMNSSRRSCGTGRIGVDKGYTEVLTDSDGIHHGPELGGLLRDESDFLRAKNARRAKIRSIAEKAAEAGDRAKVDRINRNNLGRLRYNRRRHRFKQCVKDVTYKAVHTVIDKADTIVAEDLTKTIPRRKKLGKDANRRLTAWTKGVTARALNDVSGRRGSALLLVNAAYTSQVVPCCRVLGQRSGDRLHCTQCGVVWQADHAGAINVLERAGDPDISLCTPHTRVKQILQERADRRRTGLPGPGLQPHAAESELSDLSSNAQ
ncbi:zinc ribbon domain-containing protein [Streptomyces sp. NPDC000851]